MACGVGTRLELDGWRSEKKESVSDSVMSGKTGFMAMGYSCEKWLGQVSGQTSFMAMGHIHEKCFGTNVWTDSHGPDL